MLAPLGLSAQRQRGDLARGFELERAGQLEEAAEEYRKALHTNPANLSALLGLERVLAPNNQLAMLGPQIDTALALEPGNRSIRSLEIRVFTALADLEGLENAAREWIAVSPGSAEPYAEWARAAVKLGEPELATAVLGEGVMTIGDAALAQDMAELSAEIGDWTTAAQQWLSAVRTNAALMPTAVANLSDLPPDSRQFVIAVLTEAPRDEEGHRIAADLLLGWGRPLDAWDLLDETLPRDPRIVPHLRRFADRARLQRGPEAARARGLALERIAQLSSGIAAERTQIEAARAFVEAGDRRSAERMLSRLADNTEPDQQNAASAVATLIRVMAESGRVDEAEERFREWEDRLPIDEVPSLRERIAWGWIGEGELDRAERIIAGDSTVRAYALYGWMALYRGDLRSATEYFRRAGPRTGTREEATERTVILALIQQIEVDTVPELGTGLLQLRQGDSARAVREMEEAGERLPPDAGRADVLGFAGMIAVENGDARTAQRLLRSTIESDPNGAAAPPAFYYLARAYEQLGETDQAQIHLEQLILDYPNSAILPVARRFLDRLRGAIPRG